MLEILGQSQNPSVIQSHLKKLYQGVHRVEFSNEQPAGAGRQPLRQIVAMVSAAGEVVRLQEPVAVTDDVTVWLNKLTAAMVSTLTASLSACCRSQDGWEAKLKAYPSQIHCLAEQVWFASAVEAVLQNGGGKGLADLKAQLQSRLSQYTGLDASKEALTQSKVKALVMDIIHSLDVVDQLIAKDVKDVNSWHWQRQLRFYLDKSGSAVAKMVDAIVPYTYEYQGNAAKLVHTPLTDKCYMVLTQGLSQGYGGNP
jgi:dynein heavy chain 2, cytosolic